MTKKKVVYSFENFIVSDSNAAAFGFAKALLQSPGKEYNPAYFYGFTGTGKTHLLKAIFNSVRNGGSAEARLYTGEEFYNKIVQSVSNQKFDAFMLEMKNTSMLLIDDIQYFEHKIKAVEILDSVLRELVEMNKQVVMTADKRPGRLVAFDRRLADWLEDGVCARLDTYDERLRRVFICRTINENSISMSKEVIRWLSIYGKFDLRALHGAIIKLGASSELTGEEITMEMSQEALKELIPPKTYK